MRDLKNNLDCFSGSRFQRLLEARKYRRLSKVTYKIVKVNFYHNKTGLSADRPSKSASDRAIDNILVNQIAEATRPSRGSSGSGTGKSARSIFNWGWLTVSTLCSVFAEESVYRFTRDIHINQCICQRPGSGTYVDVSCRHQ